jgi:hypothetical protein
MWERVRQPSCPEPEIAFVVGAARSGTTLLRLLLDAHPEIGCPAETGIPGLIATLNQVWSVIERQPDDDDGRKLQPIAPNADAANIGVSLLDPIEQPAHHQGVAEAIREAVLAPMLYYCARDHKRIFCDKSLDAVAHLPVVHQVFPHARYVLLFRHVLDCVASGVEASPWGFQAYGYAPFVQRSPDNFVAALVNHWLFHVDGALNWEKTHAEQCLRVRYEDLVAHPATVMNEVFAFLGTTIEESVLQRAFVHARATTGPGDHKVVFTSCVHTKSVGRGDRVPVGMIVPALLEAVNARLSTLGYTPLDNGWNAVPLVPTREGGPSPQGDRLAALMRRVQSAWPERCNRDAGSFAVLARNDQSLRWVMDARERTCHQGDGDVECVITGTAEDLAQMLDGTENPAVLLRSGRVRVLTSRQQNNPGLATRVVAALLNALAGDPQDGRTATNEPG